MTGRFPDDDVSTLLGNLAIAVAATGRREEGLRWMQAAIALDPRREYYEWLVVQYEQAEEFGRASWWLGRYLERVGEGGLRHAELRRWLDRIDSKMRQHGQEQTPPDSPEARG